jgi:hypothetical protein
MFAWPAQVVLATNQIVFTQSVHRALTNYKNPTEEFVALHSKTVTQLAELAAHLRGTSLTPHQRSTATAILVNEVPLSLPPQKGTKTIKKIKTQNTVLAKLAALLCVNCNLRHLWKKHI